MDREHHPLPELVAQRTVIIPDGQSGSLQVFILVAGLAGGIHQGGPPGGRPAETPLADRGVFDPAGTVVSQSDGLAFSRLELFGEEFPGELGHQQQALAALAPGDVLGGFLLLDDFDMIFAGQIAQGLHIRAMLLLHHEAYGRAGLAAAEALVYALGRRDIEGGRLLIVERAAGHEIGPAALQRHVIAHHIRDLRGVQNQIDGLLRYHDAISHRNLSRTSRTSFS